MAGVAIVFAFLIAYSVAVFFVPKCEAGDEGCFDDAVIGQMLIDVDVAEEKADDFDIFLEKAGQYSLLKAVKKQVESGEIGVKGCERLERRDVIYSSDKCVVDVVVVLNAVEDHIEKYFNEYLDNSGFDLDSVNLKVSFVEDFILLIGKSDEKLEFGSGVSEQLSFKRQLNFESKLKFDFSFYDDVTDNLKESLDCLLSAVDVTELNPEEKNEPEECLGDRYSGVEKENGRLLLVYHADGMLLEEGFDVPLAVDLEGLEASLVLA